MSLFVSSGFAANATGAVVGRRHLVEELSQAVARVLRLRSRFDVVIVVVVVSRLTRRQMPVTCQIRPIVRRLGRCVGSRSNAAIAAACPSPAVWNAQCRQPKYVSK